MISLRIILLILITLTGLFTAYAVSANDCDYIKVKAYELQMDRQNGIKTDWQPDGWLQQDMANAVFQQPQFKSATNKTKRARLFSREWERHCKSGIYPD